MKTNRKSISLVALIVIVLLTSTAYAVQSNTKSVGTENIDIPSILKTDYKVSDAEIKNAGTDSKKLSDLYRDAVKKQSVKNALTYELSKNYQSQGYTLRDLEKAQEYSAVLNLTIDQVLKMKKDKKNYTVVTVNKTIDFGNTDLKKLKLAETYATKKETVQTVKDQTAKKWNDSFDSKTHKAFVKSAELYGMSKAEIKGLVDAGQTGKDIYEIAKLMKLYSKSIDQVTADLLIAGDTEILEIKYSQIPLKDRVEAIYDTKLSDSAVTRNSGLNTLSSKTSSLSSHERLILTMYKITDQSYETMLAGGIKNVEDMAKIKLMEMNNMGKLEALISAYNSANEWKQLSTELEVKLDASK